MSENNSNRRLPLAKSILVWVSGAVLGWVVTVISVYYVIRTESVVATKESEGPPPAIGEAATPEGKSKMAREKPEELQPVEPASGPEAPPGPEAPAQNTPELGTPDQGKTGEAPKSP
ncbi:MAG: hypothetical protein WCF16_08195 [Alphaproteobacteria bacterium]